MIRVSRGGPGAGEQSVHGQHLLADQLAGHHPPAGRRPVGGGDHDLLADGGIAQRGQHAQPLLPVVDVAGEDRRTVVPRCRAEAVPAHAVDVVGDGHLAVGVDPDRVDGGVDAECRDLQPHRRGAAATAGAGEASPGGDAGPAGGSAEPGAVVGAGRASSTGAPAVAGGRVSSHAVGAPIARARPRAVDGGGGSHLDRPRSAAGAGQAEAADGRDQETGHRQRHERRGQAVVDQAAGAAGDTGRRGVQTGDRLDGELVAGVTGTPRVDDGVRALGQVQVGRAERDGVGAGEDDVGGDGAGRHDQRGLVRVGQPGSDHGAAGPHVDGRGRRGVPDGDAGLAGGDRRHVVDERRQHRGAVLAEVRDHGGVGARGDGHAVGGEQRVAGAVRGVGREDRQVVGAGGQLAAGR